MVISMNNEIIYYKTREELEAYYEEEKKEGNIVTYEAYLNALKNQFGKKNTDTQEQPEDENKEVICLKEPLEFVKIFANKSTDVSKKEFSERVEKKDKEVIAQIITRPEEIDTHVWWNSTIDGIELRSGLENKEWSALTSITLGDTLVHGLMAGVTGSGKSVLLHQLLCTLMVEYAPWELDIYLVDMKKVELSQYLSQCLTPHVKAVGATSEISYVISLLEYLIECMEGREQFLTKLGINNIKTLRTTYGVVLPRVLLVVDEFQQLFKKANPQEERRITDILGSITKLGRAFGCHLLFASQDMSGTLSSSVQDNFLARFALRCNDTNTSIEIIGNRAASEIPKEEKGIVIVNTDTKRSVEYNQIYKVPFLDVNDVRTHITEITQLGKQYKYDSVHSFYEEDSVEEFQQLEEVLTSSKKARANIIERGNSLIDIFILGVPVKYYNKKTHYETVALTRGTNKNVAIYSPHVDDLVYLCKLLAANWKYSVHSQNMMHFVNVQNEEFSNQYNLLEELRKEFKKCYEEQIWASSVEVFRKRRKLVELTEKYDKGNISLEEMACELFSFPPAELWKGLEKVEDIIKEEVNRTFQGNDWNYIPDGCKEIREKWKEIDWNKVGVAENFLEGEFGIALEENINPWLERCYEQLGYLFQHKKENKRIADVFPQCIVWLVGIERMRNNELSRDFKSIWNESTSYGMFFIFVTNAEGNYDSEIHNACEYLLVRDGIDRIYERFKMKKPKELNDNTIELGIKNQSDLNPNKQIAFKKYNISAEENNRYEGIDFDKILKEESL
ncbi:MAG: FtsK/SpoIIIE domain-containing protein [Eubacteriales bacterium]